MEYTNIRIPAALWERVKKRADTLKKSASAVAAECIADTLDEMDAKTPGVPKIAQVYHLMKPGKRS